MADIAAISARYKALKPVLDERTRRLLAAAESQAIGKGGISSVCKATGISRPVIRQGIAELKDPASLAPGRIRRKGGGRKKVVRQGRVAEVRSAEFAGIDDPRRSGSAAAVDL